MVQFLNGPLPLKISCLSADDFQLLKIKILANEKIIRDFKIDLIGANGSVLKYG